MTFTEREKKEIFARAYLSSSSLLRWISPQPREKEILLKNNKETYLSQVKEMLWDTNSLDSFIVKKLGDAAWYNREKRKKLKDKDYQELLIRTEKVEKFIKELEKGTEFEGELENKLPEYLKKEKI